MSLINLFDIGGAPNYSAVFDGALKAQLERTWGAVTSRRQFSLSFWQNQTALGLSNTGSILSSYQLSGSSITRQAGAFHDFGVQYPTGAGELHYTDEATAGAISESSVANTQNPGSTWNHFLLAVDTTQATLANRARIYINNVEVVDGSGACVQNSDPILTLNALHMIGAHFNDVAVDYVSDIDYIFLQLAEIIFVDGQQLTPTSFVVPAGADPLKAKKYTGTYGAQGFYLNFADSSDMGKDVSGNGNHWTTHSGLTQPVQSSLNPFT